MENSNLQQHQQQQQSCQNTSYKPITATLHIRENSMDELEALFNPKKIITSKAFKERNLPSSFFKPPEFGTKTPIHSRQNSIDSTTVSNIAGGVPTMQSSTTTLQQHLQQKLLSSHFPNNHSRSNSEPAVVTPFSIAQQQNVLNDNCVDGGSNNQSQINIMPTQLHHGHTYFHQRQFSVTTEAPLPTGWEMAKAANGQRYYINRLNNETSWQDPRTFTYQENNIENLLKLIPLPPGWEKSQTPSGESYFIDHNTQTTSWDDPRLRMFFISYL